MQKAALTGRSAEHLGQTTLDVAEGCSGNRVGVFASTMQRWSPARE
jgi:hypothetical protein